MKSYLCTVFDNKTQVFCPPFVTITLASALRDFTYAANDPSCAVGKYPADYTLYSIGTFDDENAGIDFQPPKNLGTASQFVNAQLTVEELENGI